MLFPSFFALAAYAAEQPRVHVQPTDSGGACQVAPSTQTAVIHNYLQAWQSMAAAFEQNAPAGLDADFLGIAKEKLAAAVHQQQALGLKAHYRDQAHDLKLFFCSPEGMSIELLDTVDYEVSIQGQDQMQAPLRVHASYVAVLTPTETRWKVRVFQAEPQQ
jgi:hypothetical protein